MFIDSGVGTLVPVWRELCRMNVTRYRKLHSLRRTRRVTNQLKGDGVEGCTEEDVRLQ